MKQFFLSVVLVLGCFMLTWTGFAQDGKGQGRLPADGFSNKGASQMLVPVSNALDPAATEESSNRTFQRLLENHHRFPVAVAVSGDAKDAAFDQGLSYYFFLAECLILRLEGPELICPHFYSW